MFNGYAQFGGTEIVNAARTKAYIDNNMPIFPLKKGIDCGGLQEALGDENYESPMVDDAPWYDAANPATGRFWGLFPLSMEGFEDDTRSGTSTENIGDGGSVGGIRRGGRQMRIHGVLVGEDEDAVSSGMAWLKAALTPGGCANGDCGGSSLCWYSACPNITVCYDASAGSASASNATGPVAPGTPTSFFAPALDAQYTSAWRFPQTDGTIFRYGMITKIDGSLINAFGPYVSARTNYLLNPSFRTDLSGWTYSGVGTIVRQVAGGENGGAYAQLNSATAPTVRTNLIPQSSAEVTPTTWTTNSLNGITVTIAGDAPFGIDVVQISQDIAQDDLWVEMPILGPAVAVAGLVSLYVHSTADALRLQVLDGSDAVVATLAIPGGSLPAGYSRVSLASNLGTGYTLRLDTNGAQATGPIMLDAAMAEAGAALGAYFDGDTADAGHTIYDWVGGNPGSGSTATTYPTGAQVVRSADMPTPFGPVTASVALRSPALANVTIQVLDTLTNVVLGTSVVAVTSGWTRHAVTVANGRNVYLKLTGDAAFDLDRVIVEHAAKELPYFDAFDHALPLPTSKVADYEFSITQDGYARMEWIGKAYLGVENSAVYPEICGTEWIATLDVDSGAFASSTFLWDGIGRVTGPVQSERWERTFHDVTAISGPTVIGDYPLMNGAAKEVDFILYAASPYAYAATRDLLSYEPVTSLDSTVWDDEGYLLSRNVMTDPAVADISHFAYSVGGATGSISRITALPTLTGLPTQFTGAAAKATVVTAGTSVDVQSIRQVLPVTAGTVMSFATYGLVAAVIAGATTNLYVQFLNNAGGTVSTVTVAQPALSATTWQRFKAENVTVPAGATGAILILRNTAAVPVGHWVAATGYQANLGTTVTPTAIGSWNDAPGENQRWEGVANASPSRRYKLYQCAVDASGEAIFDPTCPQPPTKPTAPALVNPCIDVPDTWQRYYLDIGPQEVSAWNQTIPTIAITSKSTEVRSIRVRFYPNPFGYQADAVDPCSYCSEFILSYIPANTELTIDGTVQRATASVAGASSQPASNLLYGTDGAPMSWPSLSCGVPYAMTIDTPPDAPMDLAVSLSLTNQE